MSDLKVQTKAFALRVIRLFVALPKSAVAQVLGKQIIRSGTSVGAHYREASRARSNAEFISKIEGGLMELEETAYWLELLCEAEIVPAERLFEVVPVFRARSGLRMNELVVLELNRCLVTDA